MYYECVRECVCVCMYVSAHVGDLCASLGKEAKPMRPLLSHQTWGPVERSRVRLASLVQSHEQHDEVHGKPRARARSAIRLVSTRLSSRSRSDRSVCETHARVTRASGLFLRAFDQRRPAFVGGGQ